LVFRHSLRLAKSQAHCPTNLARNDSSKSGPICILPELRHWNSRLNQFTIATMKVFTIIARLLLGLIFVVFGSNAFLHFLPMPPPPQGLVGDYLRVFVASGYIYVIGAMQIVGGLLLLIERFVPLGLTILAAIIFNILVFHALMAPEGFAPGLVVTALELFLLWRYRAAFAGLVRT
jgi:putative oxidoreductase